MGKFQRKTKKNRSPGRGLAAIAGAGAALLCLILLLIPNEPEPAPPETTLPTVTESPIPLNPYGPEDFTYDGDYLTCTAGEATLGVDVSEHQGEIDWEQVAQAGMEFAFVRIGYRGYTSGGIYEDAYAAQNLTAAREAGLRVGVYFYSQATNEAEAALEAAFCIKFLRDHSIDLPVVYDWEYVSSDARTGGMDSATLTACAATFCDAMEDAGYESMIYFNPHLSETLLDLTQLLDYPFWLALYSDQMTYPYRVELWQYTDQGTVPGISGAADVNLWLP